MRKAYDIEKVEMGKAIGHLCCVITYFSKVQIPSSLQKFINQLDWSIGKITTKDTKVKIDFLQIDVLQISEKKKTRIGDREYFSLIGLSEEFGRIRIYLWAEFSYLHPLIWKYARLNFSDLNVDKNLTPSDNIPTYSTSKESLIVLDPDFLIDASTLAGVHLREGANPIMYLARKFDVLMTNYYLMRGSVVNEYLDEQLFGNKVTTVQLFNRYIRSRPTYSLVLNESHKNKLVQDVRRHYVNLNERFIPFYNDRDFLIEPTFLSEKYGIRGRLDILVKYSDNSNRQDVIELKTSKDPSGWGRSIYPKDHTQAVCY